MGHQKIQSRWHRLHRLLWLEIARGLEKDPRDCVALLKAVAFEHLLAKFKITRAVRRGSPSPQWLGYPVILMRAI